jgi:hypothetical protein
VFAGLGEAEMKPEMVIGHIAAKAYAHRHAEVVMFPASGRRIARVKAT